MTYKGRPYIPRWNGKIERFLGTLDSESARSRVWSSSARRDRALSPFMRYYTAADHTQPAAAGRPSAVFTKTAAQDD
jgi:hypothetical protein